MNDYPIERFIQISKIDQSLIHIQRQLEQSYLDIRQHELEVSALQSLLEQQRVRKLELQKNVDQKELAMKILDQSEREKKLKLETAHSSREAQSLVVEIESLKKEQYLLEESLLEAWHAFESSKKQFEQAESEFGQKRGSFLESIEQKKSAISTLQQHIEEREKEKTILSKDLPEQWLEKYQAMHNRVANPVVPVINGQCSGCFYTIPTQDLANLNKRVLLQCRDCYRFLYLESAL